MTVDSWGDDAGSELFQEAAQLTRAQIALRDNVAPPLPNEGQARARRLEQMQHDIAQCADFVADLDRYASNAERAMLVGSVVGPHMARYISRLRATTVERGQHLRAELDYLRGLT